MVVVHVQQSSRKTTSPCPPKPYMWFLPDNI